MSLGRQRFSIIPAAAVTDRRLEPRDLQVLCLLGRHTDNAGWCCRSQVKMAKELGCGRATVQRSLGRLINAGYVEHRAKQRESGADAAHDYRVVIDVPTAEESLSVENSFETEGVPTGGQGCPSKDGQGVPTHERAPMLTTPVKRSERARERDGEKATAEIPQFDSAFRSWPTSISDSRTEALEAWQRLDGSEQVTAAEEVSRYVNAYKAVGRKHVCSFATYLRERRWEGLPDKPKPVERSAREPVRPIKQHPTKFQLANPHLYPELFPEHANATS